MNASRPTAAIFVAGLLALLGGADSARPADEKAAATPGPWGLLGDSRLGAKLEAAADCVKEEDWKNAVRLLQELLDGKPDVLARMAGRGGKPDRHASARAEAERLLATMPAAGREVYQETYGPRATELLRQARKHQGAGLLPQLIQRYLYAEIIQRYLYTESGPAAPQGLARQHYRAGRLQMAALCYAKLLDHLGLARWATDDLYEATVAFHHSGMRARADLTLKQLLARSPKNVVHLGLRHFTPEELRKEIERAASPRPPDDWPVYGGNAARSARGDGGPPFLQPSWRHSMLQDDERLKSGAYGRIFQAEKRLQARNRPILSAFSPITVTTSRGGKKVPLVIYKNYWGIVARELQTGQIMWASPSAWSLERLLDPKAESRKSQPMNQWLDLYIGQYLWPQVLFENSTVGTLSSDGKFVYVVEDFAVPPPPRLLLGADAKDDKREEKSTAEDDEENRVRRLKEIRISRWIYPGDYPPKKRLRPPYHFYSPPEKRISSPREKRFRLPNHLYSLEVQDAIDHNRLQIYDLRSNGKLVGELGGDEKGPLSGCYFLGPPLPLDGSLYVLVEKKQELCLACIDVNDKTRPIQPRVVSVQPLARTLGTIPEDPTRRTQAAHLAYGDGILVCPTNAGMIFGVDLLLSGGLVWAYPYDWHKDKAVPKERVHQELPPGWERDQDGQLVQVPLQSPWKASAPVLADGKVVFTPADAPSIHCLDLRDGSPLWSRKKKDGELYLGGVHDGKVLIVGEKSVEGVSLADGSILWELKTGLPSGQGALGGDVYYLPLKESMDAKRPEICAIDVRKGRIISRLRPPDESVPGNLLFFQGGMISLAPWDITAYPLLRAKIGWIDERLTRDPNDPAALTERATLRLDKGDLAGAIDDLRRAIKNKPDPDTRQRARLLFFESLMDLFQRDLRDADTLLKEYEELCAIDRKAAQAEQRRRRTELALLVARLRERQGRPIEALNAYLDLAALGPDDELVPVPGERTLKVRRDVWLRNRIDELLKRATPEQRKRLEEEMKRRLKDAQDRTRLP